MNDNFDIIEKYFIGAMQPHEITEFELRKTTDQEFAQEVFLYQRAKGLVQDGAKLRLKQHLDELGRQHFGNTMVESYMRYHLMKKYWYAIAASVVMLIGLSYFTYHTVITGKSVPTLAQLYDSYYEMPKPGMITYRGENTADSLSQVWDQAIQKYNDKQYSAAIEDFHLVLGSATNSHASAANFFMGACYLSSNRPDSAVSYFSKVNPASSLSQDASWYMALSYLRAGNLPMAADAFEKIATMEKHYKKKEAIEISNILSRRQ